MTTVGQPLPRRVIRPSAGWVSINLRELWEYRELAYFLTWRDIKVRYKQTVLGAAWAILQPLFTMIVFSIFLGRLAGVPSDGLPYPIFAFCGLVVWTYFASSLQYASNSVVDSGNLLKKVYFPRLIIPLAATISGLPDLGIALLVLVALMVYFGTVPTLAVLLLPLFVLLAMVTALSVGLWLSTLNIQYRDFRYTIPFLTQFWMFATPVAYPSSLVPEQWRALYGLNPMAGVVEGFRWALLGTAAPAWGLMAVSALTVAVLLVSGLFYFRRMEKVFADVA